jgi:hypothetical protein
MKSFAALCCVLLAWATPASAQTVTKSGHVQRYWMFQGQNYAFRVFLDVPTPECAEGFFYTNVSDDNYQSYVSGILAAALNHKSMTIYANVDNGYCHLYSVDVNLAS